MNYELARRNWTILDKIVEQLKTFVMTARMAQELQELTENKFLLLTVLLKIQHFAVHGNLYYLFATVAF